MKHVRSLAVLGSVAVATALSITSSWGGIRTTTAGPGAASAASPRSQYFDFARKIDVNRINMAVTNVGSFGFDMTVGGPGLWYPKGQSNTAMFAGGLWLGVPGPQVTVAEYSSEYAPGVYVGSSPEPPIVDGLQVFKMKRWTGVPSDSTHVDRTPEELAQDPTLDPVLHHSWTEYRAHAIPRGAPARLYRLPVTDTPAPGDSITIVGPDVSGDQMLWSVFNDGDPIYHTSDAGSTAPIGVEVRQTVYGFDRPGPLGDVVFVKWRITYRGSGGILLHPAAWSDVDLGGPADDLMGSDVARRMGYVYNADAQDDFYGPASPALGLCTLDPDSLYASTSYVNGTDPADATESFHAIEGRLTNGDEIVNPVTQAPTRYRFSGDPLAGTGWLDDAPLDKRIIASSMPRPMESGDTFEMTVAVVLGQGKDHRGSIAALRCNAAFAASSFAGGFGTTDPPAEFECPTFETCPRPLAYWQDACGGEMAESTLQGIAQEADVMSNYFAWGQTREAMCASLTSGADDVRGAAERQFAALLATAGAARLGVQDVDGAIGLSPTRPVSCPGVTATTVGELLEPGHRNRFLNAVTYVNAGPEPRALEGIDFGLPFFDGGAGYGRDFLGSSLDPDVQPDSFATVELRFSSIPQRAYRFLRHEKASDGAAPPLGRRYTFSGHVDVPFQVWDRDRNVQIEAAFAERVLTDDDGTILPAAMQPATFDSTWTPDGSPVGGREYLMLLRPAYTGSVDPALAVDGAPIEGALPVLYALGARLRFGVPPDPGDHMVYQWDRPATGGVDQRMIDLESQSLADPDVVAEYRAIASCIEQLLGECDRPTPALVSLVHANARFDAVEIEWYAPALVKADLERASGSSDGAWAKIATLAHDGRDLLAFVDRDVTAGGRYGYRLRDAMGRVHGETWIDVPSAHRLALSGTRPHPATNGALVTFSLPRRAPARIVVLDIAGRRVVSRDLGSIEPGEHALRIAELDWLPAGVYLMRLVQGVESATTRIVRVR